MDEGATEGKLLLHTARQFASLARLEFFYLLIDVLHQVVIFLNGGAEDSGKELQVLFYREVLVERELARHVTDALANLLVVSQHIQPIHRGRASIRQEEGGEDAEE